MFWAMKRLHLIFIALVLWADANGFRVWNTSVIWQAGHSTATWNQDFHLATPFDLPTRKGANGYVEGGNSSGVMLASKVQTVQNDPNIVQSSGGGAYGKPVLNSQAVPIIQHQDNLASQSSRLYWFESLKPENGGTLLSQPWTVKVQYNPGFQRPSSSQSASTTNQASANQTQSTYQPSSAARVLAGQSASTARVQSSDASTLYQWQASTRYNISQYQSIPVATTNPISESQTEFLYQPSNMTEGSAGQSASTSQAQGSYGAVSSGTAKWYRIFQGQTIPFSSQVSGIQTLLSYLPTSTTPVSATQSTSTSQSTGASVLNQDLISGMNLTSQYRDMPSSSLSVLTTSQTPGFQNQLSYQPNNTTQVLAGQSASTSQAQGSYGAVASGTAKWYRIFQGQTIPFSSQVSGLQTLLSYLPTSTTQVSATQSTSTSQSTGASVLNQDLISGMNLTSQYRDIPSSSLSVATTSQTSGFQNQSSYQPSRYGPQVGRYEQYSPVCNLLGFCIQSRGVANVKFVRSQSAQTKKRLNQ